MALKPARLTDLVENPGFASKIDPAALENLLARLPAIKDAVAMVAAAGDRAGEAGRPIRTVSVFTPCVDDAYTFGQIAAAAATSSIYATGGVPLSAVSIVAFPAGKVSEEAIAEMLRGGADKMAQADVTIIGNLTVEDPEMKLGYAVAGVVQGGNAVTSTGAQPGDALVVTKSIGTGVLMFAAQLGKVPDGALENMTRSMKRLNNLAATLMLEHDVHACAEIGDTGLLGQLVAMAAACNVDVEINWDDVPLLPGVLECAGRGIVPWRVARNGDSVRQQIAKGRKVTDEMINVLHDPQTSGGFLIALPGDVAYELVERLYEADNTAATIIGRARREGTGRVFVETEGARPIPELEKVELPPVPELAAAATAPPTTTPSAPRVARKEPVVVAAREPVELGTAEETGAAAFAATGSARASGFEKRFQEFLKMAGSPGALDIKTKQAIAISLSILAQSEPCLRAHLRRAPKMGLTPADIDEAAWMAISFGGWPVMMFYNAVKKP